MQTRSCITGICFVALSVVVGMTASLRAADEPQASVPQTSGTPKPVPITVPAPANALPVRQYGQPAWDGAYAGQSTIYHGDSTICEECGQRCCTLCGYLPCRGLCCHKRKGCNRSPDYGWSPPTKNPLVRVPVQYQRYWPRYWTGEPQPTNAEPAPRFPTVYMPTDTAQLGYYYHRVPRWSGVNAAQRPAPWPAHWHSRGCPTHHQTTYRQTIGVRPATGTELSNYPTTMSSSVPMQQQRQPAYGTVPPAPAPTLAPAPAPESR